MLRKIQPGAERLGGIAGQRGKTEEDVDEYQKLADEELIQKLREGDERIMDYILEKYKPLVLRKANAMFLIGGDTDDLIQEGMIGLFKALQGAKYVAKFIFHSRRAGNRTGASGTG